MTSLELLTAYDSEESDSEKDELVPAKRPRLPLPSELKIERAPEVVDDPSLHDGRKRAYPHERGNWSSSIFIPYDPRENFDIFCDQVIEVFSPDIELKKVKEPHISLSKNFILYYHWIKEFHDTLKTKLSSILSYELNFDGVEVYCNEDCSRTFLALTIGKNIKELLSSVKIIDAIFEDYKLPPYYEDPSFHLSFAWCLGDKRSLLEERRPELTNIFDIFRHSTDFTILVNRYLFKTGFKEFIFTLQ